MIAPARQLLEYRGGAHGSHGYERRDACARLHPGARRCTRTAGSCASIVGYTLADADRDGSLAQGGRHFTLKHNEGQNRSQAGVAF